MKPIPNDIQIFTVAGCVADGDTYKAALSNVEEMIEEWIETAKMKGRDIPQPKGKLIYA